MLRKLLDSGELKPNTPEWIIAFCNTGKERNETLDFVHEVETRWSVPVVWLEYHRVLASSIRPGIFPTERRNKNLAKASENGETTHWFKQVDYHTASRKGEPFDELLAHVDSLPNPVSRRCSTQLKLRTVSRYLCSIAVRDYAPHIGIRKDEDHRAIQILASCENFEHPRFPLVEHAITERNVLEFWRGNNFDLKLEGYEGNCDLCFLKAKWKRMRLMKENPGMAEWWIKWEKTKPANTVNGRTFRQGETYEDVNYLAQHQNDQQEFCFAGNADSDIPCSCAERGFGNDEE